MAFWFTTSSQALTAFKAVGAGSYFV